MFSRHHRRALLPLLLSALWGAGLPALAQVDDLQLKMAQQLVMPVRWDNVEAGRPYWLGGNRPEKQVDRKIHAVSLAPGERLSLRLPAGERVRVLRADGRPLQPAELSFRLSHGSGASWRQHPLPGSDGLSLLVDGYPGYTSALHLERPADAQGGLSIEVFVSRRMPYADMAPYRALLPLDLPTRAMRRDLDGGSQTYWQMTPGEPVSLTVRGPVRLAVEGRFVYPPLEGTMLHSGWLQASLDDKLLAERQFETSADSVMPVIIDGRETPATRVQQAQLEIPPGEHRLQLLVNAPFLMRVLGLDNPDYLLPVLNEPAIPAREIRAAAVSPLLKQSTWMQSPEQTVAALRQPEEGAPLQQAGLRMIQDNRSREGSVLAAVAMQEAADRRRDQKVLQAEANAFLELHTFYRDLFPETRLLADDAHFAWYLTPRLLDIGERGREATAAAQHEQNLLGWMDAGIFLALPARQESVALHSTGEASTLTVYFDTDKHQLRPAAQQALRELLPALRASDAEIKVVGHTDSRASDAYNLGLSRRRAEAVAAFLSRQGIAPSRFRLSAHAARQAVADNALEEGRQANRRVSIEMPQTPPAPKPPAHVYLLPERFSPTWLRVALHADPAAGQETVFLQFDDQEPLEFRVEATPEFAAENFQASSGETALLLQRWLHGEFGGSTLSAAFSKQMMPARLIPAGLNDIIVPPGVRQVKVWRAQAGEPGKQVWLALKIRMGKLYALSESVVMEALAQPDATPGVARLMQAIGKLPPEGSELAANHLDRHLQALARLVRSEHRSLTDSVGELDTPPTTNPPEAQTAAKHAEYLAGQGQPMAALAQWSVAANTSDAQLRQRAENGRMQALFVLGEDHLAERRMLQFLLYAETAAWRRNAADNLRSYYQRTEDSDALLTLAASAFIRDPDEAALRQLVEALIASNQSELAVTAGLLLPMEARPQRLLLRAALRSEWLAVFEQLLAGLSDPGEKAFWRGMKFARQGDFSAALTAFAQAQEAGFKEAKAYADQLTEGLAIHRRIQPSGVPAAADLAAWANWLDTHPGEREWRESPPAMRGFAGSATIRSADRDTAGVMHRADDGQPLKMGFFGPTSVRLEARPLHPAGQLSLLEGWVEVSERLADGQRDLRVFPVTQNPPADGLTIVGDTQHVPGRRAAIELHYGPGWHEVEVSGGKLPLLVRALFPQAELRLPVLPLLNADTLHRPGDIALPPLANDFLGCISCTVLQPGNGEPAVRFASDRRLLADNPNRLGASPAANLPAAGGETQGMALAAGDWLSIINRTWPEDSPGLIAHMASLLWIAEREPSLYPQILSVANVLVDSYPGIPELRPILDRLSRRSGWQALTTVRESAGQRSRLISQGEPETPMLRVRRSLLAPPRQDEFLLSGTNHLLVNFYNPQTTPLQLRLKNEDTSGLKRQPMRVALEVDGQAARFVALDPLGETLEKLALGPGEHILRVTISEPLNGQFLRVGILEAGRRGQPVFAASERFYHVARPKEPVRVQLPGPVWLRIDEWLDEDTESSYRLLADEWNEIELTAGHRAERFYRLFTLGQQSEQLMTPSRVLPVHPLAVPPPPLSLPAKAQPLSFALEDGLALGGQEDGTPSFYVASQQRSFGKEDYTSGTRPSGLEKYLESGATYRYFDAEGNAWYRGDLLARWRADGGPTLAGRFDVRHAPVWSSWNFGAQGSVFLQAPGGQDGDSLAHALNLRGFLQQRRDLTPKLYHLPAVALFARELTGNLASKMPQAYREGRIDQDIYTPYRDQHRFGGEISDQLVYRPWLDTQLFARAGVVSNPDLNFARPDHLSFSGGIQQLFGPAWGQLQLNQSRYFADADRGSAQTSRSLAFRFGAEVWHGPLHRLELGFTLNRSITDGNTMAGLTLTWHGGNGRGFTDFIPGEIDFLDLRSRRYSGEANNQVTPNFVKQSQ